MTTPSERTRALRWAGEFLAEIKKSPDSSLEMKRQAECILRHYPSAQEIASEAKIGDMQDILSKWLSSEEDGYENSATKRISP